MDAQHWKQVASDDRSQNSDDDIADQTKAGALTTRPAIQPASAPTISQTTNAAMASSGTMSKGGE
jgi:hypothetical protein